MRAAFRWIFLKLVAWNLYESETDDPIKIRRQHLATRIFLILMVVIILILVLYTTLTVRRTTVTVVQPSQRQVEHLLKRYSTSLQCPCKQISILHRLFTTVEITYHHVCSSVFAQSEWIEMIYAANISYIDPMDTRTWLSAFWQSVATFCDHAKRSIADAVNNYQTTNIFTPQIMSIQELETRVQASLDFELTTAQAILARTLLTIRRLHAGNQVVSGLATNAQLRTFNVPYLIQPLVYPKIHSYGNCSCLNTHGCPRLLEFSENTTPTNPISTGVIFDCYPVDATLASTLHCYYHADCLHRLHPTISVMPLIRSQSSRYHPKNTLQVLFDQLFIETISNQVSFSDYFAQCQPTSCSYVYVRRFDLLFMLSTIIGVIGGLVTVVKLIAPLLVTIAYAVYKKLIRRDVGNPPIDAPVSIRERKTLLDIVRALLSKVYTLIINLNLFKTRVADPQVLRRQRIATRLYLVVLVASLVCLTLYNVISVQTQTIVINHPSEQTYIALYQNHTASLECHCSQLSMKFSDFIRISPVMHQVCSSQFVSSDWYGRFFQLNITPYAIPQRFSYLGASYFQLLSSFCSLAKYTIDDSLRLFEARLYINDKVLPEWQFMQQINAFVDTFTNTTVTEFIRIFSLVRNATTSNHFVTGPCLNGEMIVESDGNIFRLTQTWIELDPRSPGQGVAVCKCTSGRPNCGFFIHFSNMSGGVETALAGQYIGCLVMDGLLISSLQCWFEESCIERLWRMFVEEGLPDRFSIAPLNASLPSRFAPGSLISDLVNELMLERWIINISYSDFYRTCSPLMCRYQIKGSHNLIDAILLFISIYGGLSKALQLIIPAFVYVVFALWQRRRNRRVHVTPKPIQQRRYQQYFNMLWSLNLFKTRNSSEQTLAHEQLVTRIYLILMFIAIVSILIVTSLIEHDYTEYVMNPPIDDYERLFDLYGNRLDCPCSRIMTPMASITQFSVKFHPACASDHVNSFWWIYYLDGGEYVMRWLTAFDFRHWASTFLIWIGSYCSLANSTVLTAINNFQANAFIKQQPLRRSQFYAELNTKIAQFQMNTRQTFEQSIQFYQDVAQANALMSLFATNWNLKLKDTSDNSDDYKRVIHQPILYNRSCSCATSRKCLQSAAIYSHNGTLLHTIDGLFHGCFLIDSFLASSLSCFYSNSCVNTLLLNMNQGAPISDSFTPWENPWFYMSIEPMDVTLLKRFSERDTFATIVSEAFVDRWSTNISYEAFFQSCAPHYCSFVRTERFNFLYVLTSFLSVYAGVTLVLRSLIPRLVSFLLRWKRNARTNRK